VRSTAAHTKRLWRRTTWQRAALVTCAVVAALIQLGGSGAAVSATPDQIGQWSAPSSWPIVAVHMSLEPNGQIWVSDAWDAAVNTQRLYNPSSNTFTTVPYGRNLFCAGHVQLPDGRTLIVGGNIGGDDGLADTTIFNSANNTYFRGPDMSVGRWYPTATVLPNGRVLAFAGDNIAQDRPGQPHPFEDASINSLPSIYNPQTNTWADMPSAALTSPLYPYMFVLSDGKVFDAGPDTVTRIFDPATATWSTVGTSPFDGMSAVMYRPNKIMKAGSWADPDFYGSKVYDTSPQTAVIDMNAGSPSWRSTAPMNFPRAYQNMTLLPDGTVLASGGMTTSDGTDLSKAVLPAEIWNPDTETWTTMAAEQNGREYHSTALLLPDGRVLMAGGGGLPGRATDQLNGEIYSPPYLFKGARPTVTTVPSSAAYGASFDVTTPNAASIAHVSLIRSPSVTHAFDQNQRFQFLNFTAGSGKVTVTAPANANLAPPGDYLLFLVDTNGVPSVGSFIRISTSGDVTPPTAPSNLTATPSAGQVALSWTASTDTSGIASYSVYRSTTSGFTPSTANRIAQPTGTSYTDVGVTGGTYYYKVTADDNAGNTSAPSNEATAVVPSGPPPGRVGAWAFEEGSSTSVADQSGNNNTGTITNATWSTSGKFGKALSFNGSNAYVSVASSSSLSLTTGMTIEGWVNPASSGGGFRTLVVKERPGDLVYGLYSNSDTNRPQSQVTIGSTARLLDGTAAVPTGTWTHLAATFDGTTERLYVNGTQVSSVAVSGSILTSSSPLKIGGNAIWGEWFNGLIDEVRVYNRALSAAEIQTDMSTPIAGADTVPPSAPGTLTATGGLGQVSLSWGAATDNTGVAKYDVYRSTTSGFTPSVSNRIAQPTGTTYTDSGLAAGTYYYKVTAEDAAGNVGPPGNQASGIATADTTPPTAPSSLTATGGAGQIALAWGASTDAGGIARYNVHRSATPGFTPSAANRIAQPTGTSYTDTGLAAGTYYYKVTADDNAGNTSAPSNEANATATGAPPSGLVATYGFDAGSGTSVADQSGNGNTGTLTNATWAGAAAGKFGNALSFNGTNAYVSVADSSSLDLTSGMTIEGWVKPNTVTGFHTMIVKETSGNLVYGLYAGSDTNKPQSQVTVGSPRLVDSSTTIPTGSWSHLAATYDGTTERLYVNGTQVGSLAIAGTIATSTSPLKIGGNAIWGEWFSGLIDEVRVYNRALSASEITTDMNSSISSPDSIPPSAPGTLTATGGLGQVSLSWGAATDNVGVTKYDVYRSTVAGFIPSAANRIAQPTGTTYTDTGLAAGVYFYRVAAEDAAGNISSPSNEASGTATGDTSPPTAPGGLAASVAGSTVNLTWTAASDNVGVVRYNVYRSTTSGFTPSAANRIAQPTGTSYSDAGLATGTYYYKVTAEDAAGNVGPASAQAPATIGDTTPPSAPGSLTAGVSGTSIALSWTASTDNIGVVRYNVHRGTTSGFTPSAANRIAQPTGLTYSDNGLAPGTYYYKVTAEDAAGNVSAVSNTASGTIGDTSPPTTPGGFTATGGAGQAALSWTASTDNVAVVRYNVYRSTVAGFIPSTSNRIAQPTTTSYTDVVGAGTYFYKVTAEDAAGNLSAPSTEASATVTAGSTGLVAAYGFDAGSGTTVADQSGSGNNGTITNATWAGSSAGKFGNALSFNGTNASVNVPDSSSLDLTNGMTVEGWVKPNTVGGFRTMAVKETSGNLVYGVYASSDSNRPQSQVSVGGSSRLLDGTASLPTGAWSHVAATYDGTTERLYVNGTPVSSLAVSGTIATSTSPLKIGGNSIWGEYFDGLIDEVRVYNRALSAGEITTDMNSSISAPDAVPPSAPGTLTATGSLGQVSLSWGAATDNVGVTKYDVYRSTASGFTPGPGNRIAQPTGTTYTDTGLAAGTYYYRVAAEDAAGNVGPAGNEANAISSTDTTPPSVSITAPSNGATVSGAVTVTANASDNGSVAGVQFKLDGSNLGAEDTTAPYSVQWDTWSSSNAPHTLTAVARDAANNTTTSANVGVTVSNTAAAGLVAGWAFDEGTGTTTADRSGNNNTGTVSNTTWVTGGKFNNALSFNGTNAWVTANDSNSLDLTTGMTIEAWLKPSISGGINWQTAVVKEQPGNLVYGMYANTSQGRPEAEVYVGGQTRAVNGTTTLQAGVWTHLAATYDGTTLRLYVNGTQNAQLAVSGTIGTSTSPVRIGGNNVWGERFTGLIDEVRIYNRALAAGEIQNDMIRSITPDVTAPSLIGKTPANGAAGVNAGTSPTATFSELMDTGTFTSSNFQLKDASNNVVPASVSYNTATNVATLTPQSALQYGATYTATIKGGTGGVTDVAGNALPASVTWSFTVEASPPQVLVVSSTGNPFGLYLGEILRNEGLDAFTTIDVAFLSPALLSGFDVVVLGDTALTPAQVTALTGWVNGGGNLIAMKPDKQLAGLLGLTDAGTTLANAYLKVDTTAAPGTGIVGSTIQYHGTADRYTLNGATAVATLYSNATTATANPAVTMRSVGSSGGQAAAFTYDLGRSVVLTRQGNPAWAGQERDGVVAVRPDDMFYGAKSGDVQPDWIDTSRIAIPQADEQQRLLVNMITLMERDKLPLPHFWYLPRGKKAVVVLSGDDHSPTQAVGGTASNFDRFKQLSAPGCVVANWECVRATSYVYPGATLTNAQAAGYLADGFEVALHPQVGSCPSTVPTIDQLTAAFDDQLAQFQAHYTSVPPPATSRTHCVEWPDWASEAKIELARGIRMDGNYYHYPGSWIGTKPGFLNGGGFPMRFADTDGTQIDVYQENTNMTDESGQSYPSTVNTLLDNALGSLGYYGAFGVNIHNDNNAPQPDDEAIVASAQARGVPLISYKQLLDWTDGRNNSTIRGLSRSAGTLTFVTTVGGGANGLQTLLPTQGPTGTLSALSCGGSPRSYTLQTIKGIQYAMFDTITGTCQATYS
jgi:fibronectin type 3 domain-containing protein